MSARPSFFFHMTSAHVLRTAPSRRHAQHGPSFEDEYCAEATYLVPASEGGVLCLYQNLVFLVPGDGEGGRVTLTAEDDDPPITPNAPLSARV